MRIIHLLLTVPLFLFLFSCTLQKREYRKGYYLHHWSDKKIPNAGKNSEFVVTPKKINLTHFQTDEKNAVKTLVTSTVKSNITSFRKTVKDSIKPQVCGDSIWFASGNSSLVKVLEISGTEIRYILCSNADGPTIVVSKQAVEKIKFTNGVTEQYQKTKPLPDETKKPVETKKDVVPQPKPTYTLAMIALLSAAVFIACGLLALLAFMTGTEFWLLFMAAGAFSYVATWVTSLIAISSINISPEKHKGKGMAWGAFAVVAAYTVLVVALLVLLFSL